MTTYDHVLEGCAPVPLAGYLKALGVFRLVAEQRDVEARGFWQDERFVLRTRLDEDELVRFFVEEYEPSPIISPWNGRAGFLEGEDEESGKKSSRQGAELVRRYESAGQRFWKLRNAVENYRSIVVIRELDKARLEVKNIQQKKRKQKQLSEEQKADLSKFEAIIKRCKSSTIANLRSEAPDWAVEWFDACQRIGSENVPVPLLGSGGNDGSRDFGMNFGAALRELFDLTAGKPRQITLELIRESLGFDIASDLNSGNLGQYEAVGGGENITSGFSGEQPFNPADVLLLLEGAVLFSGAITRRLESNEARLSFPFTVEALTAGSGAAASRDDQNFAEFWAPIWKRAARLEELEAFFTEGRTAVDGKNAKDGLAFAVAVSTLGSQRGVPEFQRFALLQREPRNPKKATPLGRIRVRENPRASLVSELEARGWLSGVRRTLRGNTANLNALGRRLDEGLFRLASDGSADAVQGVLTSLGALMLEVERRPKMRKADKGSLPIPPPPRLSAEWARAADDGSDEFALAGALASLDAVDEGGERPFRLPFRRHLAPLSPNRHDDSWDDTTESKALSVWTGRDLVRDMASVLERRLIEAQRRSFSRHGQAELPLHGWRVAPLAAVAAFMAGRTDDDRIAALAAGLAWTRSHSGALFDAPRTDVLPLDYAALKPLFAPGGIGAAPEQKNFANPLPLVRLIRAGRAADAIACAQGIAKGAGLPTPFMRLRPTSQADPFRLIAALLFPIAPRAEERLIARAYPDFTKDEGENHAA